MATIDPETGRSKGFGFIQYKNAADAKQALEKMNGFELAGRNVCLFRKKKKKCLNHFIKLKVGLVTEKSGTTMSAFGLDDEGMYDVYKECFILTSFIETEGLALNSLSRAELMAKLAARDPDTSSVKPTKSTNTM